MYHEPLECKWGKWSEWSKCTKTCGGGETSKTRKKIATGTNGGFCSGSAFKSKTCNEQRCDAPDPCPNWPDCNAGICIY